MSLFLEHPTFMFFVITLAINTFLGISIYRYASAKKKHAGNPEQFPLNEVNGRKVLLIIASVVTEAYFVVVIGFAVLMYIALSYM